MIHLDTSFLIRALAPGSPEDRKLRGWMGEGETLGMSAVAWAELLCGPLDRSEMEWAAEIVGQRQDFTPEHAALAARLFNESGSEGAPSRNTLIRDRTAPSSFISHSQITSTFQPISYR